MDQTTAKEFMLANKNRQAFAEFLASVFLYELTEEQIETFAHTEMPNDGTLIGEGYAQIKEYLRHRNRGTRQELAVDYAHVFLGAGEYDKITAPPYESVFTSKNHLLMQEARDGVLKYYRSESLKIETSADIPEDHIGFELQFMAKIIERSNEALAAADTEKFTQLMVKQSSFSRYHLENWLGAFADAIDKFAATDFYHGVANLTRGYIQVEREFLDGALEVVQATNQDAELKPTYTSTIKHVEGIC